MVPWACEPGRKQGRLPRKRQRLRRAECAARRTAYPSQRVGARGVARFVDGSMKFDIVAWWILPRWPRQAQKRQYVEGGIHHNDVVFVYETMGARFDVDPTCRGTLELLRGEAPLLVQLARVKSRGGA